MNQTDTNIGAPSTEDKAATAIGTAMAAQDKAKAPAKPAPKQPAQHQKGPVVRQAAAQAPRAVVTMGTAARLCPNEAVAAKIVRMYGLDDVDYHAIREATEEHLAVSAKVLADNLGERFEKPLEMHMQRIVDGFVRSAHGAGNFYDQKAKLARDATSATLRTARIWRSFCMTGFRNIVGTRPPPSSCNHRRSAVAASGLDFTSEPEHAKAQLAAIYALGRGGGLTLLTGVAGSGKTTLLQPLVAAWRADTRYDPGGRPSVPMTMRHRPPGSLALRVLKDDPAHAYDTDPDRR